ncbi:nucleoid DNA-binding protein [Metamycoplasma cloacale]|uniref:HU family DNA-binding protein n=1 Tax=Metamycoplasma cloacale TaxID=92401 RepID=A0A2Z4LM77_9BACT|nr:HU family DNA-binding protein [Metamycoplasma cloacale]AWX42849.1 HU family DNA-binding protein [Metamycoplasma cloacale]VEU79329.1 nucleoid DNA-binding protein [Metamycoplasma cloacale]
MNKKQLITKTSEVTGHSQVLIETIFNHMQAIIAEELAKEEKVSISGFGTFSAVKKEEKERENYFTKQKIVVAAKIEPKFKFSSVFKDELNKN